jgi:hypothetical protein
VTRKRPRNVLTHPQPVQPKQVREFFANARRKLDAAQKTLPLDEEAAHEITYGAMLKATIALMLSAGRRLKSGPGHHEAAIDFAEQELGASGRNLILAFRRMKRKRNSTFYDVVPTTRTEAEEALRIAEEYLFLLGTRIEKNLSTP